MNEAGSLARSSAHASAGGAAADAIDYGALIRRCARGDRQALRAIYDRDAPVMLGVAQRILRRRELAEEAVQDAFVQVWCKAATFDPARGSARGWLFAIVRNRALNILRDGAREDLTEPDDLVHAADATPDAESVIVGLSEKSRLRICLEAIDPRRRECVVLAYTYGLTHGEVAGRIGVPLGTAKAWIRRSLLTLKECMQ